MCTLNGCYIERPLCKSVLAATIGNCKISFFKTTTWRGPSWSLRSSFNSSGLLHSPIHSEHPQNYSCLCFLIIPAMQEREIWESLKGELSTPSLCSHGGRWAWEMAWAGSLCEMLQLPGADPSYPSHLLVRWIDGLVPRATKQVLGVTHGPQDCCDSALLLCVLEGSSNLPSWARSTLSEGFWRNLPNNSSIPFSMLQRTKVFIWSSKYSRLLILQGKGINNHSI